MEDISPSPVESGFLTAPHSSWPTPSGTLETLYNSDEQLNNSWENPRKPSRNKLQSSSVDDLDELQRFHLSQIHYSSSPNILSHLRKNEKIPSEINTAEPKRRAPQEQQLLPHRSGDTGDNERSLCYKSVKIGRWIFIVCSIVVVFLLLAVVLGCLLPRGAVKDLRSCGPPCEESWIWVGGRCYYFSDGPKTWNDSMKFCTTHGSMLAVLMDQEIKKTIERYRDNVNYWIGLSINRNGQWMWINGSLYNDSVENGNINHLRCAYLNSHLGALDCSTRRQWICVKDSS